jgi:isoleucyl-tRNA synthetase
VIKDRLYTYAPNSPGRRSGQTAVWRICEAMARLLAPILTFTCEEVWQHLPKVVGRVESVHMAMFPDATDVLGEAIAAENNVQTTQDWTTLLGVREQVMKALEEERNSKGIGKSVEAQLVITAGEPAYSVLKRYADQLRYLFIVSQVNLAQGSGNGTGGVHVEVKKADGAKCERCWNYSTHVGEDKTYPTICERCSAVLKELES